MSRYSYCAAESFSLLFSLIGASYSQLTVELQWANDYDAPEKGSSNVNPRTSLSSRARAWLYTLRISHP
eukprot:6122289-Pleurochrysis_carterae.AAC.1